MLKILFPILVLLVFFSCQTKGDKDEAESTKQIGGVMYKIENHSYSNVGIVATKHLSLDLDVNFEQQIIRGIARHILTENESSSIIFDVKNISIEKVTTGQEGEETETEFEIGEYDEIFGAPLIVQLPKGSNQVNIYYSTTKDADAIDWLSADMTRSGKYPFLYTQGEAILTRTWIPLQDVPSNRFTYSARVKVPKGMMALMSATNPQELNEDGIYTFEMEQPISSYLIALAVGELEYVKLDERSGVYAEPAIVQAAAQEFKDIPKMINTAEKLYGEYQWERYDVLFLPASFPFGGMENPRLTFATPTVLAGDGSLVGLVAHELAHSWSGNLVTNATWEDFWLNEGFTVYFENRIMEALYGTDISEMLYMIEYQELLNTVVEMVAKGEENDTKLKLDLEGRDPDDGMTDIAYVKGSLFLKTLENLVGREEFDLFITEYFKSHEFQTITTEDFMVYFKTNFLEPKNLDFDVDEWVYGIGIPDNAVEITSSKLEAIEKLAMQVRAGERLPETLKREDKITQEWIAFIRAFDGELSKDTMKMIDEQLHFKDCGNAEIMTEWYVLGIQNEYSEIDADLKEFLSKVGRRKFLEPIYKTLAKHSKESKKWGLEVFQEVNKNYHAISSNTINRLLNK